jgi:predicted lipid-binding transport protein (Tim44 family)
MSSSLIQLLVLAAIAVFLIVKLKSVLGSRDGFERPPQPLPPADDGDVRVRKRDFAVIEGGPDRDITDHVPDGSPAAYEWILMAFEKGKLDDIVPLLSKDVYDSFQSVVDAREQEGLTVEATFVGMRELVLQDATFDRDTREAEVTVRFVGEITSVIRNRMGEIVEGSPTEIKRQRDVWTFARRMGVDDPNWQLVATGE